MQIYAHIDMNSFFASCEQQARPELRGKPVGVCEHLGGIIIAPSIEAKRWGVKTGMPVWDARKLCPQIILTRVNARLYIEISRKFFRLLREYSNVVEEYSVDEAFVDLTLVSKVQKKIQGVWQLADPYEEASRVVREIKQRMKSQVGDYLQCSAGISYNKLLAKIASEMQKPNGLTIIRHGQEGMVYATHALTDIPGIAKRLSKRLQRFGVRTLVDLRNVPRSHLISRFGIPGQHIYNLGQLQGFSGTIQSDTVKSIGHVYTIPAEFRFGGNFGPMLFRLCEKIAERMQKRNLMAHGVSLHTHGMYQGVEFSAGSGHEVGELFFSSHAIYRHAFGVASKRFFEASTEEYIAHRVGITVFHLSPRVTQLSIFPKIDKRNALSDSLIALEKKHGKYVCGFAKAAPARDAFRESVGFRKRLE